jgi:hypothetical protein
MGAWPGPAWVERGQGIVGFVAEGGMDPRQGLVHVWCFGQGLARYPGGILRRST